MRGWLEDETVENGAHAISCRSAEGVLPPVVLLTETSGVICAHGGPGVLVSRVCVGVSRVVCDATAPVCHVLL